MVYERRHVAKSGRADGLPASWIFFFFFFSHLTTSNLQNLRSTILIKCSWSNLAATGQFLKFLKFSYLLCLAATQTREIQSKELASEVFQGIFRRRAHRRLVLLSQKSLLIYGCDLVDIYRTAV